MPSTKVLADYNALAALHTLLFTGVVPTVTPNSQIRVAWTNVAGTVSYFESYDDIADATKRAAILKRAGGVNEDVSGMLTKVNAAVAAAGAAPYHYPEYKALIHALTDRDGVGLEEIGGME